jgi:hypothetical protein
MDLSLFIETAQPLITPVDSTANIVRRGMHYSGGDPRG